MNTVQFCTSLEAGFNYSLHPRIWVKSGGKELIFILDTACNYSCIDFRVAKQLDNSLVFENQLGMMGFEGDMVESMDIPFQFFFEGNEYNMNIKAMKSAIFDIMEHNTKLPIHGLLGTDFFAKYNWIIDFAKKSVSSGVLRTFDFEEKTIFNFPIMPGLNAVGVPITGITFKNEENVPIGLLIDTGSDFCSMDKRVIEYYKDDFIHYGESSVMGLSTLYTTNSYQANFDFLGKQYSHSFESIADVSPFEKMNESCELPLYGILGCDFFHKYNWVIDFSCFTMYALHD